MLFVFTLGLLKSPFCKRIVSPPRLILAAIATPSSITISKFRELKGEPYLPIQILTSSRASRDSVLFSAISIYSILKVSSVSCQIQYKKMFSLSSNVYFFSVMCLMMFKSNTGLAVLLGYEETSIPIFFNIRIIPGIVFFGS